MNDVVPVYKPSGSTPLETLQAFRVSHPEYASVTLSYAGRLDPLAEGVLLVLAGNANTDRSRYERLPKRYTFEILEGISTDTYDIMGLINDVKDPALSASVPSKTVAASLNGFIGEHIQPYPPFSSARVRGKPLFWWARAGRLNEIEIPSKKVQIDRLAITGTRTIGTTEMEEDIHTRIGAVRGEFRQTEILAGWNDTLSRYPSGHWKLHSCELEASGGTYVRGLVNELGMKLGVPMLAYRIVRTAVGSYTIDDCVG
jgi:tRNA pseudouridine55 synthase